jgi:Protein of unknown function (DUF1553)/Protein of unknown function (DUF1549)/Planctomycete cytochrome C/Concanavalin A-like lectin/glucanases superfamily
MKRLGTFLALLPAAAVAVTPEETQLFEARIRPVLASACYNCHGVERQKSGLRLDWRDGLLQGGKRGPAIVPGDPDKSLLVQAIAHSHAELKMPKDAEPLSAATIDSFREWIRAGAPDPRDQPPSAGAEHSADWPAVFALRKQWWCWQPLKQVEPPDVPGAEHPVDRFLRAKTNEAGLTPAPAADPATILRRLHFTLTGLPPAPDAIDRFNRSQILNHKSEILDEIDRLLASPQFGERWARHWMDWLRYAESHGSEGDPAIPYAWRYRDYLIRALNADVPYPQLVREQIAGDLLPPRLSADGSVNEAAIGPAHLRMVFHGFTPTDALDEFVTFTDNQVDVVSKAFMGLTVSCARCHNHKFDAISQEDYYALFGIFANCRPATIDVNAPGRDDAVRARMASLKQDILKAVRSEWEYHVLSLPKQLAKWQPADDAQRKEAEGNGHGPLAAWLRLRDVPPEKFAGKWQEVSDDAAKWMLALDNWRRAPHRAKWDGLPGNLHWYGSGADMRAVIRETDFRLSPGGDTVIDSLLPRSLASGRLSTKDRALIASAPFKAEGGRLWVRAAGSGSGLRYVVRNYPRSGLIYPKSAINSALPVWFEWNLDYWKGDLIHFEVWTAPDAPVEAEAAERSEFTLWEVAYPNDASLVPPEVGVPLQFMSPRAKPRNREELLALYTETLRTWVLSDPVLPEHTEFVNFFLRASFLPNSLATLPAAAPLVREYRRLEASLSTPQRAPGVMEGGIADHPLFIRGDHKKPGPPVSRRFLSAVEAAPYQSYGSGRWDLAESLTRDSNPLTSRVIVNRLWHHVFGRGIVATPDNFGKLGELPTHPELLDWLALRFQNDGGSIKKMLKLLLTSDAFMAQSAAPPEGTEKDPENKLLSHWTLRRMEAEAIRDATLSVSGKLDLTAGGPSVDGGTPRRSVYVKVIRNALDPFLTAFDAPVPSSTRGRRDSTNVPAQALALMNSPQIQSLANAWADRVCRETTDEPSRIRKFFMSAFSREPRAGEVEQCLAHVRDAATESARIESEAARWRQKLEEAEQEQRRVFDPVRERLQNERNGQRRDVPEAPLAVAEWDFENDAREREGTLHLNLHGGAKVEAGALVVDGAGSFAASPPLSRSLRAKTLEAWVRLTTLDQAGGGVITVQSTDGAVFDSIVFAEQSPRQWLPGSDGFRRTRRPDGPDESDALTRPVHVAITWAEDGTVTCWRNGALHGQPYKSDGPVAFEAGKSNVLFGLRHGEPVGNRLLLGRIHRARLYDRALTGDEIAVSSLLEGAIVSQPEVLAAMSPAERAEFDAAVQARESASHRLAELDASAPPSPNAAWRSLALALINMKEFMWLR